MLSQEELQKNRAKSNKNKLHRNEHWHKAALRNIASKFLIDFRELRKEIEKFSSRKFSIFFQFRCTHTNELLFFAMKRRTRCSCQSFIPARHEQFADG
jgi:hypothetical protein